MDIFTPYRMSCEALSAMAAAHDFWHGLWAYWLGKGGEQCSEK